MIEYLSQRFNYGNFQGESLWIGNIGHFFVILSFILSGLAAFAFLRAELSKDSSLKSIWNKVARWSFYIHGAAIVGIFFLLFYMIFNHHYEYHYAWSHSSNDLPVYYIISAFWEGQEGSFLLWQLWHVVLGLILIKIAKDYENPVMSVVSFTQFLLGSMILGIFFFGYKIGVSPFTLLRNVMENAPIFSKPDYLSMVQDGRGLNLLLQNYWMVIHPPVLFLGFASTVVPFAYAMASLCRNDFQTWIKPALYWSLFSVGILGTGIFMGGAWAYESLSFGGFWAWDPVENASFVPWLLIVAGMHTLVAYKYTQRGLIYTYVLLLLSFIFILYSTFLTRSGILGDTSVHSFTDLGMTGQLLIYMALLTIPAIVLIIIRAKNIPKVEGEEPFKSREFWIFIGSLIFIVSAVQITWDTSLPVTNKIFGTNLALGTNVIDHYNKVQIVIGIFMGFGAAFVQFLGYKSSKTNTYFRYLGITLALALVSTILCGYAFQFPFLHTYSIGNTSFKFLSSYWFLMLSGFFALYSNIAYILLVVKKNVWQWSGSISHIGFGLFILGILISQGRQETISLNTMGIDFGSGFEEDDKLSNILLPEGDTLTMGSYDVAYLGRTESGHKELFNVWYGRKNENGEYIEQFHLQPDAQVSKNMGLVSNPDTKHYVKRDIFTHVTSIPEKPKEAEVTSHAVHVGDTIFTSKHFIVIEDFLKNPVNKHVAFNKDLIGLGVKLSINGFDGYRKELMPLLIIETNGDQVQTPIEIDRMASLEISMASFEPATETIHLSVKDTDGTEDFIIMKAIVFPYIKLMWIGGIIMLLGAFMSSIKRYIKG